MKKLRLGLLCHSHSVFFCDFKEWRHERLLVCLCVPGEFLLIMLDVPGVSSSDLLAPVHHKYYGITPSLVV